MFLFGKKNTASQGYHDDAARQPTRGTPTRGTWPGSAGATATSAYDGAEVTRVRHVEPDE